MGPFCVVVGRGQQQQKRYITIFTCSLYRCVHLEWVPTLNTDSFLMAFERFLARNPRPKAVRSDQGRQFVKADKDVRELWNRLDQRKVEDKFTSIKWLFNPPTTPHYGGFYERLVQTSKRALLSVITPGLLTDEEFITAITVAEGIINRRPLGNVSADGKDNPVLTPAHFKMG